jgi:dethiobiotin synthase
MFRGIFVTGTDTNVGKTVVSAALMLRYRDEALLRYWKPIQTGIGDRRSGIGDRGSGIWDPGSGIRRDDDTAEVVRLSNARSCEVLDRGVRLPDPVSPHLAAQRAGTRVTVRELAETLNHIELSPDPGSRFPDPGSRPRWIVEGAGGLLVPINERETMADLIHTFDMPVLVAARSTLGTINHTLLTIEALRRRMLRVAGVVMVGPRNTENRVAIEKYGAVEVLGEMPLFDPLTPDALRRWVAAEFDRSGVLFVGALR